MAKYTEPAAKGLIAALLLISTGTLIRRLFTVALADAITFSVGLLWLLGDLIPCVTISILVHDILNARIVISLKVFKEKNKQAQLLNIIVLILVVLYSIDLVVLVLLRADQLKQYRNASFHIQVLLSVVYSFDKLRLHWKHLRFPSQFRLPTGNVEVEVESASKSVSSTNKPAVGVKSTSSKSKSTSLKSKSTTKKAVGTIKARTKSQTRMINLRGGSKAKVKKCTCPKRVCVTTSCRCGQMIAKSTQTVNLNVNMS